MAVAAVAAAAAESSSSSTSCLVVISIIVTSPPPFPTSLRPTVGPQLRYNSTAVLPQTIKQTDFYAGDGLTYRYFRRVKRPTICDESRDLFLPSIDYFGTHNMPWVFSARGRALPLRPRPFVHKKPLPPPRLHIFKYGIWRLIADLLSTIVGLFRYTEFSYSRLTLNATTVGPCAFIGASSTPYCHRLHCLLLHL